jgi:hypothetical protein
MDAGVVSGLLQLATQVSVFRRNALALERGREQKASHRKRLRRRGAVCGVGARPAFPIANVRVMVPDVDGYWKLANEIGAPVIVPIADRYYGLRDFVIADPDGFGVRFASILQSR